VFRDVGDEKGKVKRHCGQKPRP